MIRHILLIRFTEKQQRRRLLLSERRFYQCRYEFREWLLLNAGITTVRKERMPVTHIVS